MFGVATRNIEQERIDAVDALTALDVELGHHMENAKKLSSRITMFERIGDQKAFRDLCNAYAEDFMRDYFSATTEDDSPEARIKRIEMRAKAEAVKSMADLYEMLITERAFNSSRILQTKQAIIQIQQQLEDMTNG
jgi:hypothetical protein